MYRLVLSILIGVALATPFIAGTSWWFVEEHMTIDGRLAEAYKRGWRDALSTQAPVNDDLETACMRLWFEDQEQEAARRGLRW